MSSKLKSCKTCNSEIAKSAKVCPSCGQNQTMGLVAKALIALTLLVVIGVVFAPSSEDIQLELDALVNSEASKLSPYGELKEIFSFGSEYTDLQRDNKEKELIGSIVEWSLPIYEVSSSNGTYIVQTQSAMEKNVGAFIYISPRSESDKTLLESIKTGESISFKGEISDISMRMLVIKPAVLVNNENKRVSSPEVETIESIESIESIEVVKEAEPVVSPTIEKKSLKMEVHSDFGSFGENCREAMSVQDAPIVNELLLMQRNIEQGGDANKITKVNTLKVLTTKTFERKNTLICDCIKQDSEEVLRSMSVSEDSIYEKIELLGIGMKQDTGQLTDKLLAKSIGGILNSCISGVQSKVEPELNQIYRLAGELE